MNIMNTILIKGRLKTINNGIDHLSPLPEHRLVLQAAPSVLAGDAEADCGLAGIESCGVLGARRLQVLMTRQIQNGDEYKLF